MIQDGLQPILMAEMHREVWAANQTDRSQCFQLLPIHSFLEVISRSASPFLCLRFYTCV